VKVVQLGAGVMPTISSVKLPIQSWIRCPSVHEVQVTSNLRMAIVPELPTSMASRGSPENPPILTP